MRDGHSVGNKGQGRALVPQGRGRPAPMSRDSYLVVAPPRPAPLTLKTRRAFSKLTLYGILGTAFAIIGYGAGDPSIRRAFDYRVTLAFAPGMSSISPTAFQSAVATKPLSSMTNHLFAEGQKGPRADRYFMALNSQAGNIRPSDKIARRLKAASLELSDSAPKDRPIQQTAAIAGAALFMTALNSQEESPLLKADEAAGPPKTGSGWAGLLKNASLSPEQPSSRLFGGLTEDEFRERELRCMATAIYFEARDEPVKGQIAVGQVIMNRIRSPYYPKTVCGVVYQGERLRSGCQFSFTCNGRKNHVTEKPEWAMSVKVAKQVIAREVWIDEIAHATHYHATYVRPDWRHELDRVAQIGGHIFYKPKPGTVQVALLSEGL